MAKVDDGCDENFIKAEEGGRALVKQSSSFAAGGEGLGRVEKFFYGPYMRFLERSKYINIALFLALAGLSIYFATLLAPPVDTEAFMPERHMVTKFLNFYSPSAGYWASSTEDMTEDVHLVWGIKGMDTSTRSSVWNTSDRGTLVWDEEFVPFSEAAQKDLLRVCPAIRQMNCRDTTTGCTKSVTDGKRWLVRRSLASPGGEGDCWVEEMENWLLGMNLTMPLPPQEFESKLLEFYETFNGKFREQIGYVEMDGPGNGLALKYLAITFPSTFSAPQAMKVTGPVMDDWEAASREVFNEAEEPRMSNGFMTSGYAFVWYFTQQSLVMNALMGLGLVFAISFVVINIATLNIVMSLITTLVIAGIVVTVLGVGAKGISDWDFGTAESIATVILIGFSMDYCLHLAGAYIESEAYSREDRVRESLTQLGVSVVAGAITTILSGIFLWGTVMIFFQKFAFLITFTVIVSFLWAIVLLPSLLLVIGPQGSFGSWAALFRLCTGKKSNAVTPS